MSNSGKPITYTKFTTMLASALVVIVLLSACGNAKNAQALVAEAIAYQQKGDDRAAIIQLKNALQQSPNDPEIRHLLGTLYNKVGDPQSAEKELSKALSLGLDPVKVLPDLGQAWLGTGQFQQLLDETEKLNEQGDFAELFILRGNASLALGKLEEAKALFEQTLQDQPASAEALIGTAKYFLMQNDMDSTMRYAEEAVRHNPENSDAALFKGDLLRAQGKIDEALAAYDRAIELNPEAVAAYINRATISIGAENFESAQADLKAVRNP